ncbi:uncharacterized protein BDV17DRAFT_67821 [Aspergillus undulatus]|uniref:uncharacterized protein n=1 Tax=Aspergillus undulatus TaxID=1810928 RepID=UPI003CCDDFAB
MLITCRTATLRHGKCPAKCPTGVIPTHEGRVKYLLRRKVRQRLKGNNRPGHARLSENTPFVGRSSESLLYGDEDAVRFELSGRVLAVGWGPTGAE